MVLKIEYYKYEDQNPGLLIAFVIFNMNPNNLPVKPTEWIKINSNKLNLLNISMFAKILREK